MILLTIAPIAAFAGLHWRWLAALVVASSLGANALLYFDGGIVRPGDVALTVAMIAVLTAMAAGVRRLFGRGKNRQGDHAA